MTFLNQNKIKHGTTSNCWRFSWNISQKPLQNAGNYHRSYHWTGKTTFLLSMTKSLWLSSIQLKQPSKTSKDNVVHFARTPLPGTETGKIDSLSQVDVSAFANHVADILKMLPGGMFVLGIFVVGPKDVFTDNVGVQKLKTLVVNLQQWVFFSK